MLAADKHHAKAGSAGNRSEPRTAVLAEWIIGRRGGSAHRTIESFSVHRGGLFLRGRELNSRFLVPVILLVGIATVTCGLSFQC